MTSLRPWLAAALLVSTNAVAAEPVPPPPPERRWYGAQTLIADGLSVGSFVIGAKTESTAVWVVGASGYVLVPPFIHWSHGKVATGFGSLALRVIPPVLGALLLVDGLQYPDAKGSGNSTESWIGSILILASIPTAVAIDAAVLAYDETPVEASQTRWMPSLKLVRGGATLGASGTF